MIYVPNQNWIWSQGQCDSGEGDEMDVQEPSQLFPPDTPEMVSRLGCGRRVMRAHLPTELCQMLCGPRN